MSEINQLDQLLKKRVWDWCIKPEPYRIEVYKVGEQFTYFEVSSRDEANGACTYLNALEATVASQAARIEALEKYADHKHYCALNYQRKTCSCGWDALRQSQPASDDRTIVGSYRMTLADLERVARDKGKLFHAQHPGLAQRHGEVTRAHASRRRP